MQTRTSELDQLVEDDTKIAHAKLRLIGPENLGTDNYALFDSLKNKYLLTWINGQLNTNQPIYSNTVTSSSNQENPGINSDSVFDFLNPELENKEEEIFDDQTNSSVDNNNGQSS